MAASGYTASVFTAGEQPTVSKWNYLWSNDASFYSGTGINDGAIVYRHIGTDSSWAWQSWTPNWTNLTVGNGTVTAKYTQIGKLVHFRLELVFGSTTSVSGAFPTFSLPVAAISSADYVGTANLLLRQPGVVNSRSTTEIASGATTCTLVATNAASTYAQESGVSSTIPFTWATGNIIAAAGFYEAA